jgi:hypothetical protein
MHPSNETRRQGTYGIDNPIALAQLAAWQALADGWSLRIVTRGGPGQRQLHLICADCRCTVFVLVDKQNRGYQLSLSMITAGVVAHLRNIHRDQDPTLGIGINGRQDTQTPDDVGVSSTGGKHSAGAN